MSPGDLVSSRANLIVSALPQFALSEKNTSVTRMYPDDVCLLLATSPNGMGLVLVDGIFGWVGLERLVQL